MVVPSRSPVGSLLTRPGVYRRDRVGYSVDDGVGERDHLRELYVSLAAVGGLLLLLGVLGGLLKERTPISEPLIALLAGVLIGPAALGLLDLAEWATRH